ncbi:hypothetical protein OC842_005402, partial [Tilletia horrida]
MSSLATDAKASTTHGEGVADPSTKQDVEAGALPSATSGAAGTQGANTAVAIPSNVSEQSLLKDPADDAEAVLDERVLQSQPTWSRRWLAFLARYKLELQGIEPVPVELRQDRNWLKIVGLWFSASFNLLLLSTGSIVPDYAISHLAALIAIPLWVALFSLIPAYICTFGPVTGLRTMVFTRYSWGPYGTIIICIFNAATGIGYSILNAIQ